MNTQELRQNIEKVLGNNIRCLLPSYWWKKLFNQVVDTVEDNALPIVKSEEDLKNLEVPEGSIASVVDSIVWKSFASFKLPSPSNATSLLSYPHIQKINVTNAPITITPKTVIGLTDMQYTSQQTGKLIVLGIEDNSVMGYGYSIVGGEISGLIGPYTFRSAYSTTVNTTAVNALNSLLSTSVFRFIGFELFSGNSDDEQAAINQLCSIFTWGDTSNGVYVKDEKWQRLALTTELPDISGITNIQVDDTMSSSSTNPVQNKVITEALNNKVDKIQGKGLSSEDFTTEFKQKLESLSSIESVTWSELKTLRDSSTLSPGTLYRITDYVTTTSQPDTRSSGYGFDVVVLATSVNTLLEEAFVVKRDDDIYFTEHNSNLNAWKIWYCLDNDAERFAWASDTGKGVIYRMIDEFGNDCPYDFKNIQFKRWKITSSSSELADHLSDIEGKYVGIMKTDDFENYMPTYLTVPDVEDYKWLYTFSYAENDVILDLSLKPTICEHNIIKSCSQLHTLQKLNNIVFGGSLIGVEKNTFDPDCFCMTIGNVFGEGEKCFSNKFGQFCRSNIFINSLVSQNIFDDNMAVNLFTGKVVQNTLLKYFQNNKFFNDFTYNTIDQSFGANTVHGVFTQNTFGVNVNRNIFNGNIKQNNFGSHTNDNILTDVSQCNFGFGFQDNYLNYALNTTGGVLFQNNDFARIVACTFGNGCRYNTSKLTNNLSGDTRPYIQGCTFGNYVWYTNLYNSIEGSNEQPIRCITIPSYFQGNETEYVHVEVPVNSLSEVKVARNSQGDIKVYCEADLVE